jgi:hypothetical protein
MPCLEGAGGVWQGIAASALDISPTGCDGKFSDGARCVVALAVAALKQNGCRRPGAAEHQ